MGDVIKLVLHSALDYLGNKNTYIRLCFTCYSVQHYHPLQTCYQIHGAGSLLIPIQLDFLIDRSQSVQIDNNTTSLANIRWHLKAVRSVLCSTYSMLQHSSKVILKLADDTTAVGRITGNDESKYKMLHACYAASCKNVGSRDHSKLLT